MGADNKRKNSGIILITLLQIVDLRWQLRRRSLPPQLNLLYRLNEAEAGETTKHVQFGKRLEAERVSKRKMRRLVCRENGGKHKLRSKRHVDVQASQVKAVR